VWEKEVKPMTNREFYTAIANGTINEEVIAHATASLTKMDEANEKRKNKPSKTAEANAPILVALTEALTADYQTASDLATTVGISTQKASSLLRQLVANGTAVATDIKVPKKGTCKGYALAPTDAE
jgi:predicted HTH transcriptional regulator